MAPPLTAGEECRLCGQAFSAFASATGAGAIPSNFITMAMAISIVRGSVGVAIVRLKTGEWSAPCAIMLENPSGQIQPGQDTILLFMSETSVLSLVSRTRLILNSTHRFEAGPYGQAKIAEGVDIYGYVRFNNAFTPADLIQAHMTGWGVREDMERHARWHGPQVTWADVLMNKISVDRSSIGNTLYVVANMAAGGKSTGVIEIKGKKNFADLEKLAVRRGLDGPNAGQPQGAAASPTVAAGAVASPTGGAGAATVQQLQLLQQQQQQLQLQQQQQQQLLLQQQQAEQQQLVQLQAQQAQQLQQQQANPAQQLQNTLAQIQQQLLQVQYLQQTQGGLTPQQQQQYQQLLLLQQQTQLQLQQLQQPNLPSLSADLIGPSLVSPTAQPVLPAGNDLGLQLQLQAQQQQRLQQQLLLLQQQAQSPNMMLQAREHAVSLQVQKNLEDQIKSLQDQAKMVERQQEAIRNAMRKI